MMEFFQKQKNNLLLLVLILALAIPSLLPLFHPGFPVTDDGEWMIIRFSAFHQAFRDGQFPVRFLGRLNHGYGYPVANFLYPGFMYLAEPIKLMGIGFVPTIKILIGLSLLFSAIFSFLWLRKYFSGFVSFVGALMYLYTPYHMYDLFKRGSVGEVLGITIVPFIFWQIERESILFTTLGISLMILSHNTLAVLFMPVIVFYWLIKILFTKKKKVESIKGIISMILAFGTAAFFWIPAILELHYTRFSHTQVSEWQQYFADPKLVGYGSMIVVAAIVFAFIRYQKWKENTVNNYALLFMAVGIVSTFLSFSISTFVWKLLPVAFVQFPYRFLSLLIPSAAFLTAYILSQLKTYGKSVITIVLGIVLIVTVLPYIKVSGYLPPDESLYATNEDTTTVKNEYMPLWVQKDPDSHFQNKIEMLGGVGTITNRVINSKRMLFTTDLQSDAKVRINTVYYPGWKAYLDGKETQISYKNPSGVMELSVPVNTHSIQLRFTETPLRIVADFISILAIILLFMVNFITNLKYYLVTKNKAKK